MSDVLKDLLEKRETAYQAYETFVSPLVAENRSLSEEEDTQRAELRDAVKRLDERIDEVKAEEDRKAQLAEARKVAGFTVKGAGTDAAVISEPKTYQYETNTRTGRAEEVHGHSYVRDLLVAQCLPASPKGMEAQQRLQRHGYEQAVEAYQGTKEGRSALRSLREEVRESGDREARDAVNRFLERGNSGAGNTELRAGTSSTIAGFTTPVYFVDQWLAYRVPGRPFANVLTHMDLPDYGLTVYRPHFTGSSAVAVQASENTAVTETDPTSAYLSATLSTLAGQVTVSIQLLERSELRDMDSVIFADLNRQYARQIDILAITQSLAGAGSIAFTNAGGFVLTGNSGVNFWQKTAGAKAAIETAAGQNGYPQCMFLQPTRWEYMVATAFDTQTRPLIVPNEQGPVNTLGSGDANRVYEGYTGFVFQNLPVFKDLNIPAPGTGADQAVILDPTEIWLFENVPTPRVLPQTLAQNLSVVLQVYGYAACLVGYPAQVQSISGTGMAAITF